MVRDVEKRVRFASARTKNPLPVGLGFENFVVACISKAADVARARLVTGAGLSARVASLVGDRVALYEPHGLPVRRLFASAGSLVDSQATRRVGSVARGRSIGLLLAER